MKILEFTNDPAVTQDHLNALEIGLNKIYAANGIDFNFTKHFLDRVNDPRNKKQITLQELVHIFVEVQKKYGRQLENTRELQAVMKDLSTDVNAPFVIEYNPKTKMLDLYVKSVMRKHNFKTSNPELTVEEWSIDSDYKTHRVDDYEKWKMAVDHFQKRNKERLELDDRARRVEKGGTLSYYGQYGVEVAQWNDEDKDGWILSDSYFRRKKEKARKEYGSRKIADIKRLLTTPTDIGKHNKDPDNKYDPRELALGVKTELEHTKDRQEAENIAKDHLSELPDYYSKLQKMEKGE